MTAHRFMFATGIENSYPTIKNGSVRVDEMETGGHYKHWETDFALLQDLDIRYLRYGPPLSTAPGWLTAATIGTSRTRPSADLKTPQHRTDRGSLPLRRAGLDRQLPKPRLPGSLRRVCPRLRRAVSLGAALHACERDVRLRHLLGRVRLVERAARERSGIRDRAQAHRQSECAGHACHPGCPAGRYLRPERVVRVLPRR